MGHRDLKPANIVLMQSDQNNDGFILKIADFGLAKSFLS
jgi:serine/threonine protein kinase